MFNFPIIVVVVVKNTPLLIIEIADFWFYLQFLFNIIVYFLFNSRFRKEFLTMIVNFTKYFQ